MTEIALFIAGIFVGIAAAFVFKFVRFKTAQQIAQELYRASDMESKFGSLSLTALSKATDELLKLAHEKFKSERDIGSGELENKKILIDRQLQTMNEELGKISGLVTSLEKDRESKFSQLSEQLKNTNEKTAALLQTTHTLNEALTNSRARGQLGEWMAEDILRVAGYIEGVNYFKQKAIDGVGSKPDFTFTLPNGSCLNMDVKFPFDNYLKFLSAKVLSEKERYKTDFFKDVKLRLKEITGREYINAEQKTVDYVILFVPNEQVFSFIHEEEPTILNTALKNKVIFCSPLTLFAVLSVIRQAVDNFMVEQTSHEILSLLGAFNNQWNKFVLKLETVGKRIDDAQKEFQALTTTRKTQLEKPLGKIEQLRIQKGVTITEPADEMEAPLVLERETP